MDINFSDKTINTFSKIDTDKNGVSVNELKKLDTDNNGEISSQEGEAVGIDNKDLNAINKVYKTGSANANQPIFMDTAENHGWEVISMELINNSVSTCSINLKFMEVYDPRKTKEEQLDTFKNRLGDNFKPIEPLTNFLNENKLLELPKLELLVSRVGADKAKEIGDLLMKHFKGNSRLNPEEKKGLIRDLINETAIPPTVTQGGKGTCAACAVQMRLAIQQPLKYTQMALDLVEGKNTTSVGNTTIKPNDTWRNPARIVDEKTGRRASDDRSISSKALQNAFMNEALTFSNYKSNNDYNNSEPGLSIGQQQKLLTKVFGDQNFDDDYWSTGNTKFSYLEDEIARGRAVVSNFSNHAILVVGIDKAINPPKVVFWSDDMQYQMDVDKFKKDLVSVVTINDDSWDNHKVSEGTRTVVGFDLKPYEFDYSKRKAVEQPK